MRQPHGRAGTTGDTPAQSVKAKKPYLKPAFRHERVFETTALICGKITSTESQCKANLKLS